MRQQTIIGSDNGLSHDRHQAIIWTNAGILLIGRLGTNFSEILIEVHTFSFTKLHLKMSSPKWWPCCLGLNVLITPTISISHVGLANSYIGLMNPNSINCDDYTDWAIRRRHPLVCGIHVVVSHTLARAHAPHMDVWNLKSELYWKS